MILFSSNIILPDDTNFKQLIIEELGYYMEFLNNGHKDPYSMGKLEASASEDYVRKVNKMVVQRGPITFAKFKDIVTNPLVWEKYHQPERRTRKKNYRDSPANMWRDEHGSDSYGSPESPKFFYYTTPFSVTFRYRDFDDIIIYLKENWRERCTGRFGGPGATWFQILKWLEELSYSGRVLPDGNKDLNTVMKWWRNFNPYPTTGTPPCLCIISETALRANKYENTPPHLPPVPFLCTICDKTSHTNRNEVAPSQLPPMDGLTRPSPTLSLCEIKGNKYDSPQLIQDTQARTIAPLPRRYRDMPTEEEAEADEGETDLLQHPRKKQKTTHIFDYLASETESMMTDTDAGPPESSYEDDMSVDEDFWSAKSTAELSMLSID